MKRKVLALVLTMVMLIATMPFAPTSVYAEDTVSFDELIGTGIEKGLISRKYTLDTAEQFSEAFSSYDTTDGVLTMPAEDSEVGLNNKTDGFPVGSALHFKVDGFFGSNTNEKERPSVTLYWVDSAALQTGYHFILRFEDVEGVPTLYMGDTLIQSEAIDTAAPFEIMAKRTATEEIEVYGRQSDSADAGYIKLATESPEALYFMNQINVKSGNGQGIKFDYIKVYRNNEPDIVNALKANLNANGHNTLNYYRSVCGISGATWTDFNALSDRDPVYAIDTTDITTAEAFGAAFTAAVEAQKEAERVRYTFDELVGTGISKGLIARKVTLDTADEFATLAGFDAEATPATDGVLTMPAEDKELTLSSKTDGFPVGSAMHFKVDGFEGTNSNATDRPGVIMYWLDSSSPKVGYYFMLKFKDVNGKPALHFGNTSIQSTLIDTATSFEVLIKRTGTTALEIYAKQSADEGYIKLATKDAASVNYMNQISIKSGNGQSMKLDYLKVYQNNEAAIVSALKANMSAEGRNTLNYYSSACGITSATWADFDKLANKDAVYGIDTSSITTAEAFGAAFTAAVAAQKAAEIGELSTFDEIVGTGISKGLIARKVTLDTADEFATLAGFDAEATPATDGVLTMPAEDKELTLNNKTDGFPVGSAMHFKVDGFVGANSNATDRPGVTMYWLDSSSPKAGYYFMLKFKDVNGKPALHFGNTSIQSAFIDTAESFEVLVKRTATEELEIYAKQATSAGYIKLTTVAPTSVAHMNQISIKSGNGQSMKLDYLKVYQNNEASIVSALKASMSAEGRNTLNYYSSACGITAETWADFDKLANKDAVYGIDTSAITTAEAFGAAFTAAVAAQKAIEIGGSATFDEIVGTGISKGLISKKVNLDTEAEFNGVFASSDATDGILTMPAENTELTLNNKTDGFPVGSAMHFKVDGFVGANSNATDRPGVTMYWLDSSSPKAGYYFMLKFKDVNGKPALHFGNTSIQSVFINTAAPFEVLVKRTAKEELEIYAKQATSAEYIKLTTVAPTSVAHMNQISIKSGNGQSMKLDYLKVYQNNEVSIVSTLKANLNADGHNTLNYYKNACGITAETWADFIALTNKDAVYGIDTSAITTADAFGAAFTAAVAAQKAAEMGELSTFDEIVGAGISKGLISKKLNLDTEAEFNGVFASSDATNGVLTMPAEDTELTLNNKTDGFPVGSAMHFKVDGFVGANSNATDKPSVTMYWLDSSSPKVGYYFMLKFKDVNGKPALHFGNTSIQSEFIDTTAPFEVLVKRTATEELEIYATQSADAGYIKLTTVAPASVPHMNQISIKSGNGQSMKLDYIKVYQNNEASIVSSLKANLNADGHDTLNYYRNACGITDATWADFAALDDKAPVYAMDTASITTADAFGAAFTAAVAAQKAAENVRPTFDEIIGAGIAQGVISRKVNLDTEEEFNEVFASSDATDGVLTMPAEDTDLALSSKTDGFPVGSAMHFKVDGFVGTNSHAADKPAVIMYWLDSSSPKAGYYFMLKFRDVNGKPALHFGGTSIQSELIDTTAPFEVLVKRTATEELVIYARQTSSEDAGYIKLAKVAPTSVAHMNQIVIKSGNGQGMKLDYLKVYQNNEPSIVSALKANLNADGHDTLNYYRSVCGITDATWADFAALEDKAPVYAMDKASITTAKEFGAAFTAAVAAQKAAENVRVSFDEIIGAGIAQGVVSNKVNLDTEAEFNEVFASSDATDGVLTMPAEDTDLTLNNKTDGFPVGSAMHFKVDGFVGTNSHAADKPAVIMYWLDSSSPKAGYYFMLKFRDVNGKPALHFGGTSIQSDDIDTTAPFEVLVKRTAKEELEIYARQSADADAGYIKLAVVAPASVAHMNQIAIKSGNGQGMKLDYFKIYQNNEASIVSSLKANLNEDGIDTLNYYRNACGIAAGVWTDFLKLNDRAPVYAMDTASITTAKEFGTAFTAVVAAQKAYEATLNGIVEAKATLTKSGDSFVGTISIENDLPDDGTASVMVMVALYGEKGQLLAAPETTSIYVTKGYNDTFTMPAVAAVSGTKYAKIFVWEKASADIIPLCNFVQCNN